MRWQPLLRAVGPEAECDDDGCQMPDENWEVKDILMRKIARSDMGRDQAERAAVEAAIVEVEATNPTPIPLESPLLSGCWRLVYTTSDSILGSQRPRPFRPRPKILQSINAESLTARNEEWTLAGLLKNQVKADLTPRDDGKTVDVRFRWFGIGWLRVPAPASAVGELCTTYLDEELRISRGNKNNVFVLVRDGDARV